MQIPWEKPEDQPEAGRSARKSLPVGSYTATVVAADVVKNFRGDDSVKIVLGVQGGPHHGTWVTEYFDVSDKDADRSRMARRKLQHLAKASGVVDRPYTTSELVGARVQIQTKLVESAKWGLVSKVARFDSVPLASAAITAESGDGELGTISVEDMPF